MVFWVWFLSLTIIDLRLNHIGSRVSPYFCCLMILQFMGNTFWGIYSPTDRNGVGIFFSCWPLWLMFLRTSMCTSLCEHLFSSFVVVIWKWNSWVIGQFIINIFKKLQNFFPKQQKHSVVWGYSLQHILMHIC